MSEATLTQLGSLRGRRILVVEDEYMIAQEIADELWTVGAETLGPVARIDDALGLIEIEETIDAALLDVNLGSAAVWPVVDSLLAYRVPVVLATGYDASAIPAAYAHLPRCEKPMAASDLVRALAQVLVPLARH
ncbi:MAG: response regulator [Janthinobacterium lividum]